MNTSAKEPFTTLQSIVDQLEFCNYKTEDDLHELKMNAAFIKLKEVANKISIPLDALVMQNLGGVKLIAEERQEQINKHGWTAEHDDEHQNEELLDFAIYCLTLNPIDYPENWNREYEYRMMNKSKTERLKIAGAVIAAEIDRENRRAQISA